MAKKWSDVAASSAFQALSFDEQEEARRQYFEQVVAPRVPTEDLDLARSQFLAQTVLQRPANDSAAAIDYTDAATAMQGTPTSTDNRGLIQRIGDFLRPAPKPGVMEGYVPTPQERQAEIDKRLSYGAGPISQETVRQADVVRSTRGTRDAQAPANRQVEQVVQKMDERKERSFGDMVAAGRDSTVQRMVRDEKAEEWRTAGEWAADTLSGLAQGVVTIAQLPVNIVAPSSALADSLRQTQKELQAQESDVLKAQQDAFRERLMNEEGFFGKYFATVKALVTNPALGISEGVKQLPNFLGVVGLARAGGALGAGAVAAAGRAAPTVALADAIGGGALTAAARAAGTTAGGLGASMAMTGGDAAGQVYETLTDPNQTDPRVWRQNPDYQKLLVEKLSKGRGEDEARALISQIQEDSKKRDWMPEDTPGGQDYETASKEAIKEIATAKARMAALITAPLGVLGFMGAEAAVATRGLGKAAADALTFKGAAKTALKDNLGEQFEEAGTAAGGNVAIRQIDPSRSLMEGVPEAAATAAVTSSPFSVLGAASNYQQARQQLEAGDPFAERVAADVLRTERGSSDLIRPEATVVNFTPPDSATKRAGLVDIEVPVPNTPPVFEDIAGVTNVGTAGAPGGLAAGSGQLGGGIDAGGMAATGRGALDATGLPTGTAGGLRADDRSALPAGGEAGQPAAGLGRPFSRSTDADLLARTEAAVAGTAPVKIWAGRAGDGYATEGDAQQALPGLQRKNPTLDWSLQQNADGKFIWSGFPKETTLGTQTDQALQGQAQGLQAQAAGAAAAQAGAAPAQIELSDSERAGLKLALPAPAPTFTAVQEQLVKRRGVTVEAVPVAELTDSQRVGSAVARLMGNTLTVVRATSGDTTAVPNGFINRLGDKHIFIDANADDAPVSIALHEGLHSLPAERRKALNTALLEVFNQDQKGEFLREFGYTADKFDEEAPAMMAQAVSKRQDFWEELRDKMGNREFGEVAKVILTKLNQVITGAKDQYGEAFVNKYIKDVVKARDLLTTAYAESMQAQGFKPDVALTADVMASNRAEQKNIEASRIEDVSADRFKRTPALQQALADLQAGTITRAEYSKVVDETRPVYPYKELPEITPEETARFALANGRGQSAEKAAKYGLPTKELTQGEMVQLRLDIPSYQEHDAWVVTVHRPKTTNRSVQAAYDAGPTVGYESVASITNATFGMRQSSALKIAQGTSKGTIATVLGEWKPITPAEAKVKAQAAMKSKEWTQVGMDPFRHSYFYDRDSMRPVVAADEVIQVGPLVLAKNAKFDDEADVTGAPLMFSEKGREPVKVADYNAKTDNFNKQQDMAAMLREAVPAETITKADEFVAKYYKERQPVAVPPEDRLKAEILLRPKMQAAEQVKPEYDQKILDIAARTGAVGQMLAPIKGIKRAAEKLAVEENFQADNIKDLLRSTIVVENYADALPIVDEIRKEFDVIRIKDRAGAGVAGQDVSTLSREDSGGYGDILINVRMPNGTIGEIQINTPAMLAAKSEQGHKLYEAAREQPEGSPLRREIYDSMRVLYDAAFEAANLRAPSAQARNLASESGAPLAGSDLTATSSSPESASLNTLPSGNETNSSPENEATNSQPGGKEAGTFIEGSPDNASVSQSLYPSNKPPRRGADRVGDFDVRTMKDGTIVVYGDSAAIRTQIPDDVKGRVTKEGIVFTNAAAPRVKAALAGRKTAYSRGGEVVEKLPMKGGKYLGAPEKYNTPAKIAGLRKSLRKLTLEGERGRYWYENSSREVLAMVGGNVQEARKFVALLAIYSPQAKVDANSTFALRAWAQYKAGQPISVKTGVMDAKAQAALDDVDAFWSGEKTGNFFFNLLREIDPSTAGKQGATIDMWMMRAGEYATDAPTATQYAFMENETNRLAQELGWEPQQVQAAIWVAMKARMENSGVKKRTEASSEKNGWIRFDYPLKNGKPVKTRVILNAQKHRDNWLKHAFQHVPSKADTEQAKFDFSDGVRRHIGQISWEARPGRSTGVLPGVNDAPYEQQVEFQQAVQKALLDDDGVDLLAYKLGLLVDGPDILAPGIWQGEVAAGMQKQVVMAPAKGPAGKTSLDPAQKKALDAYAATLGLLLRQEGVGYHRPFYKGTMSGANGVDINVGRSLTPQEAQALWGAIDQRMTKAGVANWEDGAGMISSPTGIRVVNFGALPENKKFHNLVEEAASTLAIDELEMVLFSSDGDLITNDWKSNPNGQSYQQRISAAGSPDLLGWARSVLAPRVQAVFDEFSSRYGWGDPGTIEFSNRPDATGGGRDRAGAQEEVRGQVTPSYGTPRDGAVSAVGYHYSRQSRASLTSSAYGTGLRGAEISRLEGADPRLKQRIYFYIDRGTGINPEAGVGGFAHKVDLRNLYDMDADPLRLARDSAGANAFEVAILDAGFDGYMVRDAGPSGNAVLLGRHAVPVQQLGSAARMQTADVVPAAQRELNDAEMIAANKMLPAGQISGKRWAELISRGMPDVYARLADSPVWQSDKLMYRSELARELQSEGVEFSNKAQTDTPEFKRWFGDSKVVDENGKPLVVYHGTTADFNTFDTARRALGGEGSWFSARPLSSFARGTGGNIMPVYLSLQNPKVIDLDRESDDVLKKKFIEQGYDGVMMLRDGELQTAVAFYPTQIKSAIGNSGAFDPNNPDITMSNKAATPELDKEVVSLFKDLQGSRGLGRIRVQERVDAHPMAETIRQIDKDFMDILERLDDAGLVKINCK